MNLRRVNLNLLPILLLLLRTQSVSASAAALGLSQPSVSGALARLRTLFNDALLVRVGGSLMLTSYAHKLLQPLEALCSSLEGFIGPESFDPRDLQRELVIATSDFCGFLLAHPILALLRAEAPGMSLHLIEIEHDLMEKMAARKIDFALLPQFALDDMAPAPLNFAPLVTVETVVLMRRGHPLGERPQVDDAELAAYPHIVFQPDAVLTDNARMWIFRSKLKFQIAARVGQMLLVPHLVVGSDAIAIIPRQLATAMSAVYPLISRDLVSASTRTQIGLAWSPVFNSDSAHQWFRSTLPPRVPGLVPGFSPALAS